MKLHVYGLCLLRVYLSFINQVSFFISYIGALISNLYAQKVNFISPRMKKFYHLEIPEHHADSTVLHKIRFIYMINNILISYIHVYVYFDISIKLKIVVKTHNVKVLLKIRDVICIATRDTLVQYPTSPTSIREKWGKFPLLCV